MTGSFKHNKHILYLFLNGSCLEYKPIDSSAEWVELDRNNPVWNFEKYEYRLKDVSNFVHSYKKGDVLIKLSDLKEGSGDLTFYTVSEVFYNNTAKGSEYLLNDTFFGSKPIYSNFFTKVNDLILKNHYIDIDDIKMAWQVCVKKDGKYQWTLLGDKTNDDKPFAPVCFYTFQEAKHKAIRDGLCNKTELGIDLVPMPIFGWQR